MQSFLLLALTAGIFSPIAAISETWRLVIKAAEGSKGRSYSWKIPTTSEAECNAANAKVVARENWKNWTKISQQSISGICLKGK